MIILSARRTWITLRKLRSIQATPAVAQTIIMASRAYITKIANQVHDVACLIQPDWVFAVDSFENTIAKAEKDDIIYCDPPYIGRYVDYYNG